MNYGKRFAHKCYDINRNSYSEILWNEEGHILHLKEQFCAK